MTVEYDAAKLKRMKAIVKRMSRKVALIIAICVSVIYAMFGEFHVLQIAGVFLLSGLGGYALSVAVLYIFSIRVATWISLEAS